MELFRHTARCNNNHGGQGECKGTITSEQMPDGTFRITIVGTSALDEICAFSGCIGAIRQMSMVRAKEELEGMIEKTEKTKGVAAMMESTIEDFVKSLKLPPLPKRA